MNEELLPARSDPVMIGTPVFPADAGSAVVARRDGRVFYVLTGQGFEDFAQAVGRAAPDAEVRVNDMPRRLVDWLREPTPYWTAAGRRIAHRNSAGAARMSTVSTAGR